MSMTTDDTQVVEGETQESRPRTIGVLLALDTYQGMTDEEIEMVIDYKTTLKSLDNEMVSRVNAYNSEVETMIANNDANNASLHAMLEQILAAAPVMQTIESEV